VCLSLLFPLANGLFLYQYRQKLANPHETRLRHIYGALYEEYKMGEGSSWWQYMHASFFAVRRLAFIMLLVYLKERPAAQLIAFQILNFLVSIRTHTYQPCNNHSRV
jgi:hypothetical protein